jgi:hypothetical protein
MVDVSVADGKLTLHVRGADKLWAFKSSLEIPLEHVSGIRADPAIARGSFTRPRQIMKTPCVGCPSPNSVVPAG